VLLAGAQVIFRRNPIYGALSLVGCFFFLSGIYVLLAAHLIAILQILVYAGAVMVLFVFVIMLLNLKEEELGEARWTAWKAIGVAAVVAGLLFALGAAGVVLRRNAIIVLMSIELMLNAVNLTFLAFSRFPLVPNPPMGSFLSGHAAAFFVIATAAAEAAVGLAIIIAV